MSYSSSQLIDEFINKFTSNYLGAAGISGLSADLRDKIEELKNSYDEKEAATEENKIVKLRSKVKEELLVMARSVFRIVYQFMVRYLPAHHNVVDPLQFYEKYQKSKSVLLSLPQRL